MRILFITDRYPPFYDGGYEINCEITANTLRQKGHEVLILTSNYGIDRPQSDSHVFRLLRCLNKQTHPGMERRLAEIKNAFLSRINFHITKRLLKQVKPDICVIWRMGSISIFPITAIQSARLPIVYELGDYWLLEYQVDLNENNSLKKAYRYLIHGGFAFRRLKFDNLLTVSKALKKSYTDKGFQDRQITVIPRGIPEDFILAHTAVCSPPDLKTVKLLYAGRLVPEKGAHLAIEAVRVLKERGAFAKTNVVLDIIGSGPGNYLEQMRAMVEKYDLSDRVRMLPALMRNELFEAYCKYDIMLMPAIWEEPFGNTVLESMARRLPVIASSVGGLPELIEDGVNGLLVPPGDIERLADAILKLIADPELYNRIRTAGSMNVWQNYRQQVITDRIEKHLLDSIATGC